MRQRSRAPVSKPAFAPSNIDSKIVSGFGALRGSSSARRLKIAHVVPALTKGGAEHVVINLANAAARAGHSVTILAAVPMPSEQAPGMISEQIERRYISRGSSSPRLVYPKLILWMLRNWSWLESQDVVHCHLTFGAIFGTLLQIVRGRRARPAVVETYHAVGMAISPRRRTFHAALLGNRGAVAFVAEDPLWRRFAAVRPLRLMRTIRNGVALPQPIDSVASERYRERIGLPKDVFVVGTISRLIHERRPDLLLEAFAHLTQISAFEVHLLLAGEGPERPALLERAWHLGLADCVHFPGLVLAPHEPLGLIDLYLTLNVGAVTGIAALEAAVSGIPVIAAQLSPDFQPAQDDWIWSSTDPQEIAARAVALINDPEALRALGQKQQRYALKHHGVEAMAKAYYRLYEEAIARRKTDRGS